MNRHLLVATFIASTLAVAVVNAQPPGFRGRGFGRGGYWRLLDVTAVQRELKLEKQQLELLADLQTDLTEQRRGAFPPGGPTGGERREGDDEGDQAPSRRFRQEIFETMRAFTRQGEELVAVILEPGQFKRLNEIRLQSEGTRALNRPELLTSLDLSDEQLREIRKIQEPFQGARADRWRNRRSRQDREKMDANLLAVLSAAQMKKWEAMKGDTFNFPRGFSERSSRGQRGGPNENGPR